MRTKPAQRTFDDGGAATTPPTAASDPLAVQQLSDPLTDPLQGAGDLMGGDGGAVQFEDANAGGQRLVLGEAERIPIADAGAEGALNGGEGDTTTPRIELGEAERIPIEGEGQSQEGGEGGSRIWLGEAERIDPK